MREIKKIPQSTKSRDFNWLYNLIDSDFLTGLYNRQGFVREVERYLKGIKDLRQFKRKRRIYFANFSIIFIDFDGLKLINDKYGHRAGDRALKLAAKAFQDSVRDFDIVSRWGGDEFVIGLIDANEKEALRVAERIRKKIELIKIKRQNLSASFGISTAINNKKKEKILNIYELIERADMAMYEAKKKTGKNFVMSYHKIKK